METQPAHFSYCLTSTSPPGPRSNTQKQGFAVTSVPASVVFGVFFLKKRNKEDTPSPVRRTTGSPPAYPTVVNGLAGTGGGDKPSSLTVHIWHMGNSALPFSFSPILSFSKRKKKRNIHICMYVYIGRGKKQSGGAALLMGDERQALSQLPGVVERRGSSAANPTHPYADT